MTEIERTEGWVTNRVVPGPLILGTLGDIEAGVRQLIRRRPLETIDVRLPSACTVRERMGVEVPGRVLAEIDAYYADQHGSEDGVASQLARQLAEPRPADGSTTRELHRYRNLDPRRHAWSDVEARCTALAECMLDGEESEP